MTKQVVLLAQLELIERFRSAYNAVDQHLRQCLDCDRNLPFSRVLTDFLRQFPNRVRNQDFLRLVADVRNILVHDQAKPFEYPAVPAEWMVQQLEETVAHLVKPQRVIPMFQCRVQIVAPDDSIAKVLEIVAQHNYSQFPVYYHDRFRGLLTENGITRWLAQYSRTETIIDFADARVRDALKQEEAQDDCIFVDRHTHVDDVAAEFVKTPNLEAAIVTQHGRKNEKPIGIVTRWNVAQLGVSPSRP